MLLFPGCEIALFLQGVEHGIERARAHPVAVMGEFLHHPLPVDFFLRRVMEDVQTDEPGQYLVMFHGQNIIVGNAQSANRRGDPRESYWAARAFSIR